MTIQHVLKGPSAGGAQGTNQTQEGSSVPAKGNGGNVPTDLEKEPETGSLTSVQANHIETHSHAGDEMVSAEGEESVLLHSDRHVLENTSAGGSQGTNETAVGELVLAAEVGGASGLANSEQGIPKDPLAGGAQGVNRMLDVENIVSLVMLNMWTMVEEQITTIIDDPSPISIHPVLFMHIRRSQLLYLLEKKKIPEAVEYYASHIVGPFGEVIKLGQDNLVFASIDYLRKEVTWCGTCVKGKKRLFHVHGERNVLKDVICDYFRIYIRDKISFEVPSTHKLWQFAFKTETPSGKGKPSFRCMVCSVREFTKDSIGKIEPHLNTCFLMETQYLQQLFRDSCSNKQTQARPKAQSRILPPQSHSQSRLRTTGTSVNHDTVTRTQALIQLPVLTREALQDRFKAEVSTTWQIQGQLAVALPNSPLPRYLANALGNIEMYSNLLFSSEQAVVAVPETVQRDVTSSGLHGARLVVPDSSDQTGMVGQPTPAIISEQHTPHLPAGQHNTTEPQLPGGNGGTNTNG